MVVGSRNPMLKSSFYYLSKSSSVSIIQAISSSNQISYFSQWQYKQAIKYKQFIRESLYQLGQIDFEQKMWQLKKMMWWHSLS